MQLRIIKNNSMPMQPDMSNSRSVMFGFTLHFPFRPDNTGFAATVCSIHHVSWWFLWCIFSYRHGVICAINALYSMIVSIPINTIVTARRPDILTVSSPQKHPDLIIDLFFFSAECTSHACFLNPIQTDILITVSKYLHSYVNYNEGRQSQYSQGH